MGPCDESQKVGQGSKGQRRPGGPCWTCGGPLFQRENHLMRLSVKAITQPQRGHRETRHISRTIGRPMKFVASATQGKGEGKGKKKRQKGRQRKGTREPDSDFFGSPLLQLQDSWSCAPATYSEHWDSDSDLNCLLPKCALGAPSRKLPSPPLVNPPS